MNWRDIGFAWLGMGVTLLTLALIINVGPDDPQTVEQDTPCLTWELVTDVVFTRCILPDETICYVHTPPGSLLGIGMWCKE